MANTDSDIGLTPPVEINPAGAIAASVIWLHGLGADGHDFEPLVPELGLPEALAVRFVFPHAPYRAVTVNNGYVMRAWYDVRDFDIARAEDAEGIRESGAFVEALIRRERDAGVAPDRIVLAGFSQGGAIALHAGLRFPERLAGILALSAYVPLGDTIAREVHGANRATPILLAHGTEDPIIPIALGRRSRELLQELGYPTTWRTYGMAHNVCAAELRDIADWLAKVLAVPTGAVSGSGGARSGSDY